MPDLLPSLLQKVSRFTEASISGYGSWLDGWFPQNQGVDIETTLKTQDALVFYCLFLEDALKDWALTGTNSPKHPGLHPLKDDELLQA